jgi:hypothetical protein
LEKDETVEKKEIVLGQLETCIFPTAMQWDVGFGLSIFNLLYTWFCGLMSWCSSRSCVGAKVKKKDDT